MGNERIVDDVAGKIFFAEGKIDPADADAEHAGFVPEAGDAFEINVEFADVKPSSMGEPGGEKRV